MIVPSQILKIMLNNPIREPKLSDGNLSIFYNDVFPEEIYREKHPNFSEEEFEYVKKNYRNPVKQIFGDALDVARSVFFNDNFRIKTENQNLLKDIEDIEMFNFFKQVYVDGVIIDPNSILTFHIKQSELSITADGRIASNEQLPIYPYLVASEKLIYNDKENLIFEINGDFRYNFVYINNEKGILTYSQYNFDTVSDKKEPDPTFSISFRNLKSNKLWRNADGVKKIKDNELVIESYFSKSVATLSDIMFNSIERTNVESRFNFPTRWYYADSCEDCGSTGEVFDIDEKGDSCTVQCKKCHGTGKKNDFGVFKDFKIPTPKQGFDNVAIPTPAMGYSTPPQEPQQYLTERIEKDLNKAFAWLGIEDSNTDVKGSETALSKMIDREEKFTSLKQFSTDFKDTIEWFIQVYIDTRFYGQKIDFTLQLFSNFKTTSSAELNEMFTTLQKDNAPMNVLRPLLKEYYESIHEGEKFPIVDKYYSYKSDEMLRNLYAGGLITAEKAVISRNIQKWIDLIDISNEATIESQLMELASKELGRPILQDFNNVIQTPIE